MTPLVLATGVDAIVAYTMLAIAVAVLTVGTVLASLPARRRDRRR